METTGERWRLGRRPALDGLRGVAILLVVALHAGVPGFAGGGLGVTVFFTLSGFLITALLLEEHERAGRIGLGAFYMRRARRLLPALFAFVAAASVTLLALSAFRLSDVVAVLLYAANWVRLLGTDLDFFAHTWSLSIEEQFYIAWPLLLIAVLGRYGVRAVAWVAAVGMLASLGWRQWLVLDGASAERLTLGTDAAGYALLAGCLLATVMRQAEVRTVRARAATWGAVALGLLVASAEFAVGLAGLRAPLVVAVTVFIIWCVTRGGYSGWLTSRALIVVGQRSYGLYLWHWPVVTWGPHLFPWPWLVEAVVLVAVSWLLTVASWRFVEQPFMRPRGTRRAVGSMSAATVTR